MSLVILSTAAGWKPQENYAKTFQGRFLQLSRSSFLQLAVA